MKNIIIFILNYVLELLKLFLSSWQIVVLIVVIIFKKDITNFMLMFATKISNIKLLKLGDVEIETMDKVIEEYPVNDENIDNEYPLEMQFLNTWIQFEKCIKQVLISENIQHNNIRNIINVAYKNKIITSNEKKVLKDILGYRNFIVHCEGVTIQNSELDYFIDFLKSMMLKIEEIKNI